MAHGGSGMQVTAGQAMVTPGWALGLRKDRVGGWCL